MFVAFTFNYGLEKSIFWKLEVWNVVELFSIFVRTVVNNVNLSHHRTKSLYHIRSVHIIHYCVQFKCLSQIVWLLFTVNYAAECVELTLRETGEHSYLQNIARTVVWHFELTTLFYFILLFAVDVIKESLSQVHSRSWHSWWPVKLRVVPLS